MTFFKVTCRCSDCGHKFSVTRQADNPDDVGEDPPCPKCDAAMPTPIGLDIAAGKAPAVGGSVLGKAMDSTMNMVAQDYQLTDLKTDGRPGSVMAPDLSVAQQGMADRFLGGGTGGKQTILTPDGPVNMGSGASMSRPFAQAAAFASAAQSRAGFGAFSTMKDAGAMSPVQAVHGPKFRPPVTIVNGSKPTRRGRAT